MAVIYSYFSSLSDPIGNSTTQCSSFVLLQDSSGMTLMDLITADPSTASARATTSSGSTSSSSATAAAAPSPTASAPSTGGIPTKTTLGERKSKRAALLQIQNDTVSAAKAVLHPVRGSINIMPQKQKQKKKVLIMSNLILLTSFLFLSTSLISFM